MYHKLSLIIKKIKLFFKNILSKKISYYHRITPKSDSHLPDTTSLEQTMFMFQRIRVVFDFAPPIPLIAEMRIINRGLAKTYETCPSQEKDIIKSEIIDTVKKFSYILPEIDFLLTTIENMPAHKIIAGETEDIKQKIIIALEKISDDTDNTTYQLNYPCLDKKKNYYLFYDDKK
jgi:hypothetical protein